jgi:hypothetical protein
LSKAITKLAASFHDSDGKVLVEGREILFGDEKKIIGEAREVLSS